MLVGWEAMVKWRLRAVVRWGAHSVRTAWDGGWGDGARSRTLWCLYMYAFRALCWIVRPGMLAAISPGCIRAVCPGLLSAIPISP